MKILNSTPSYINQIYTKKAGQNLKAQKTAGVDANKKTDQINFSDLTKNLRKMSQATETDSADRQKYVADIKHKVETNQYTINAETIAEKMVGSIMNEFG